MRRIKIVCCFVQKKKFSVIVNCIWSFGTFSNFLKAVLWLLRKPFKLFTLLRFFQFNCVRLFVFGQVANVVVGEVFVAVTKFRFSCFFVVSNCLGFSDCFRPLCIFPSTKIVLPCLLLFNVFQVVFGCVRLLKFCQMSWVVYLLFEKNFSLFTSF